MPKHTQPLIINDAYTPDSAVYSLWLQLTQRGKGMVSQNPELAPEARLNQHLGNNRTSTSIILLKETL